MKPENTTINILGNNVNAWMSAAFLAHNYQHLPIAIQVICPTQILQTNTSIISLPAQSHDFHLQIGLTETALLAQIDHEFILAHRYQINQQSPFFLGQSQYGVNFVNQAFFQHFLRFNAHRQHKLSLEQFNLAATFAKNGKFAKRSTQAHSALSTMNYGYQVWAQDYQNSLKAIALKYQAKIVSADVIIPSKITTDLRTLKTTQGDTLFADFWIDCTDSRALHKAICNTPETYLIDQNFWQHLDLTQTKTVKTSSHKAKPYNQIIIEQNQIYCKRQLKQLTETIRVQKKLPMQNNSPTFAIKYNTQIWCQNVLCLTANQTTLSSQNNNVNFTQHVLNYFTQYFNPQAIKKSGIAHSLTQSFNRKMNIAQQDICEFHLIELSGGLAANCNTNWQSQIIKNYPHQLSHKINLFNHNGQVIKQDYQLVPVHDWAALLLNYFGWPNGYSRLIDTFDTQLLTQQITKIEHLFQQLARQAARY